MWYSHLCKSTKLNNNSHKLRSTTNNTRTIQPENRNWLSRDSTWPLLFLAKLTHGRKGLWERTILYCSIITGRLFDLNDTSLRSCAVTSIISSIYCEQVVGLNHFTYRLEPDELKEEMNQKVLKGRKFFIIGKL